MRRSLFLPVLATVLLVLAGSRAAGAPVGGAPVTLQAADGTQLAATYYSAGEKPGPGILLCHQCNLRKWAHLTAQARAMLLQEERRTLEIIDYFQSREARILGNERLREPQRAAYLALYDHFVKRRRALPADRLSAMFEDASALLDRLLIRLVAAHQKVV